MILNKKAIGNRIRKIRLARGISQHQLAMALKTSTAHLEKIERGIDTIELDILVGFCNVFSASPDYILGFGELTGEKARILPLHTL